MKMTASEQLADAARRLEAGGVEGCSGKYAGLAFRLMAPLATVYASWVLGRARAQGIQRLYFLSRDCRLIWEAAKKLAPRFGAIECRYLQVSRQALFLPSATGLSEQGMPWLFENTDRHALGPQLAKLELTVEDVVESWHASCLPPVGPPAWNTLLETDEEIGSFWQTLNTPPLSDRLTARIEQRRAAAKAYFEQEGLFDDVSWAVVDIGWLLRCQRALNGLLQRLGRSEPVHGFYLGVQAERETEETTGPAEALFYNPAAGRSPMVFKQVVLIENLFCTADHPTVHRYEGRGPCYNRAVDPAAAERFQCLEKAVVAFAEQCAGFAGALAEPQLASALIEGLIDGFLNEPVAETVRPLQDIRVSVLQNDLDPFPVVRPLTAREALVPAFPSWKGPHVLWHRGSVAVSRPWIQKLYFAAYRIYSVRKRLKNRTCRNSPPSDIGKQT